ncbi:hypothetical protein ISP17_10945 [Dyella ginsengisoli]|uniref:DoxX family protein n=2 Tax=Dyella ginsengisoli TaxID=363848 RepID=A0ABW8JTN1_9GAMM
MQRLYTMFPDGRPGIGLALVRVALAVATLVEADAAGRALALPWLLPAVAAVAIALGLGLLAPIASVLALLASGAALRRADGLDAWICALAMLNALALFLLGPGAYSLDARIYGRRLVVMQDDDEP